MIRRALFLLGLAGLAQAHEPITTKLTWSQEISRIVHKRCVSCHREGGQTPMSLVHYEEARPWAKAIRDEVLERRMPPWGAVKGFGEFANDASLSEVEIERIANWVEGGAPEGNPIYLPPAPDLSESKTAPVASRRLAVEGNLILNRDVVAVGIEPPKLAPGASVRASASRPDGSSEPLLWVRDYQPKWRRVYFFREPVKLPKGSEIQAAPAATLLIASSKRAR